MSSHRLKVKKKSDKLSHIFGKCNPVLSLASSDIWGSSLDHGLNNVVDRKRHGEHVEQKGSPNVFLVDKGIQVFVGHVVHIVEEQVAVVNFVVPLVSDTFGPVKNVVASEVNVASSLAVSGVQVVVMESIKNVVCCVRALVLVLVELTQLGSSQEGIPVVEVNRLGKQGAVVNVVFVATVSNIVTVV